MEVVGGKGEMKQTIPQAVGGSFLLGSEGFWRQQHA